MSMQSMSVHLSWVDSMVNRFGVDRRLGTLYGEYPADRIRELNSLFPAYDPIGKIQADLRRAVDFQNSVKN